MPWEPTASLNACDCLSKHRKWLLKIEMFPPKNKPQIRKIRWIEPPASDWKSLNITLKWEQFGCYCIISLRAALSQRWCYFLDTTVNTRSNGPAFSLISFISYNGFNRISFIKNELFICPLTNELFICPLRSVGVRLYCLFCRKFVNLL